MKTLGCVVAAAFLSLAACGGGETPMPGGDYDNDGIPDATDQCPRMPETINNFEDEDGCPDTVPTTDSDHDGIADSADACPTAPETPNGYQDSDGCPDTAPNSDADGDGIPDASDSCPNAPETKNGYQDADGCPDTVPVQDSDNDGVADSSDRCPSTRETVNGYQDTDGCPDVTLLYAGWWKGQATLTLQNETPWVNNAATMTSAVDGTKVTFSPICPFGDGYLTTTTYTDQTHVSWRGSVACNPISFTNGCQYVVLTYTDAAFSLSTDGKTLGAAASGTATGCGITKPFTMTFAATRQ